MFGDCLGNNLTSLYVSNNPALQNIDCSENSITSLKMSGVASLSEVYCPNNDLTFSSLLQERLSSDGFFYTPQSDVSVDHTIQI